MAVCFLFFVSLLSGAAGIWNENYRNSQCHPSACAKDGDCWCSDKFNGWFDGGVIYPLPTHDSNLISDLFPVLSDSTCYKAGVGDCKCMDCGKLGESFFTFEGVQCQDSRCNDETDTTEMVSPYLNEKNKCYRMDPVKGKVYTKPQWYFNCYTKKNKCDASKCLAGQTLVGCMRTSKGACQSCGKLEAGMYWTKRGECGKSVCGTVEPGYYMTAPCSNTTNTVKLHCSEHTGNPKAAVLPNPVAQYYCPGGAQPPVRVPSFGKVNSAYTDFNCNAGYSKHDIECRVCLTGSACMYDKSFTCKANYYTDNYGESVCHRCTSSCVYPNELPMRCSQGSKQNSRCVSCGVCGEYPATGVNCVKNVEDFQKLPDTCTPVDTASAEIVCKEG